MLLTAAMIVRNEEVSLADCLASVAPLVDEIVIADTGSTDRSREIAHAHGARVIEHRWTENFAAARNAALDQAHGRWILYIDADERLAPVERRSVEAQLAAPDLVAGRLWLRPKAGFTPYREYRLFRNDPRIRFEGIIHEKMLAGIFRVAREDRLRIAEIDLFLEHVGYEGSQEPKHRRNLPLLRSELALRPDNPYNWHHLGRCLDGLGDRAGALKAWRRAVGIVRRRGVQWPSDWLAYVELMRADETDVAVGGALLGEATRLFPENPLLRFCTARYRAMTGNHHAAIPILEALAAIDAETYRDPGSAYDKRLFCDHCWAALGSCHFKLGDFARSAHWFAKAAAADTGSIEYRVKHQLAASKAGRLVGADAFV